MDEIEQVTQVEQVKIFVAMYSTYDYVKYIEDEANEWLKGLNGKITIIKRDFCCYGGTMYLVYYYTLK